MLDSALSALLSRLLSIRYETFAAISVANGSIRNHCPFKPDATFSTKEIGLACASEVGLKLLSKDR